MFKRMMNTLSILIHLKPINNRQRSDRWYQELSVKVSPGGEGSGIIQQPACDLWLISLLVTKTR